MKGDFHIHSNISDCDFTPDEIGKKAIELGLTHIALTDHDIITDDDIIKKVEEKYKIKVIKGIEISAYDYENNKKVHILGYGKLGENTKELCKNTCRERHELSKKIYEIIKNEGYNISWENIENYAGKTGVFKQHIMLELINKGYTANIYGELYKKLFKNHGIVAHLSIDYAKAQDAVKAIKKDGGIAVIAHPAQYKNEDIIPELVNLGLDGIEVYHQKHTEKDFTELLKIAEKYNLLITGGSDFHGNMDKEYVELGSSFIDGENLEKFLKILEI